jgi:competence protein ComEA
MKQRFGQIAGNENARYVGLGVLFGLILLTVALIWRGSRGETIVLEVQPIADRSKLRVYVGGAVEAPGLYTLERGSRVADAISAAGGVTANGDVNGLGMAAPLRDADQIIVASRAPTASAAAGSEAGGTEATTESPVNINLADSDELEQLPGIGPTIAARIIDYRQRTGFFRSVDDLEAIQWISERMVEELRPLVTTGP